MSEPLTPHAAQIRLAQYGERTKTWSTATYDSGTEKALHEIALTLSIEVDRLRVEVAQAAYYSAALETNLCHCRPECEDGEYLHESTCPVVEIQMQSLGCPGFEGNPIAPDMCAGCHESSDRHASGGAS